MNTPFSWLSFTVKLLKRLNLYSFSPVSLLLLTSESFLIHFCPTKTLCINITMDLDLDKSLSSIRHSCPASCLKYVSSLGFQGTSHWLSLSPLQLLLSLFAFVSLPLPPLTEPVEDPRGPSLIPFSSLSLFTSVGVSSKLKASNTIKLPLTLNVLSPAPIYSLISCACIQFDL